MKNSLKLLCFLLVSLFMLPIHAQNMIVLNDSIDEVWINSQTSYFFEDSTSNYTLEKVKNLSSAHFKQPSSKSKTNSNKASTYWLKFWIVDQRKNGKPLRVELYDYNIEQMSLYLPTQNNRYRIQKAGFLTNFSKREIDHKNISFALPTHFYADTIACYMKFKSRFNNVLKPVIKSYDQTINYGLTEYMLLGFFYGLMALIVVYNLVYYFILRKLHYLFFVLYALTTVLYLMTENGTGFQYLWPNHPNLNIFIHTIFINSSLIFLLLFSKFFLEIKVHSKTLRIVIRSVILVKLIGFILELIFGRLHLFEILDVLVFQFILGLGIYVKFKGNKTAIWFIVAFALLDIGFLISFLEHSGIIDSNIITVYSFYLGIICQFVFLTIGLAENVKEVYREKNNAQKQLIKEYKRNETLKEKVNRELEQKVQERTLEIQQQKELIEQKNEHIIDSVRYAKTIQDAALPNKNLLKKKLPEHFILFMPRDIVSGDFYWYHELNESEYLIAAVDCTGHGVPGAFMSMVGINLLNRIVSENIKQPGEILSKLHYHIQLGLKQNDTHNTDGMDMGLCLVNRGTKKITFAGAKNPLLYTQNGTINRIRGSKNSIGGGYQPTFLTFEEHEIDFGSSPVNFYLLSDGYQDQFGGPNEKKYMIKQLMNNLEKAHDRPMNEQCLILHQNFYDWKGNLDQIDDVLIVGLREE